MSPCVWLAVQGEGCFHCQQDLSWAAREALTPGHSERAGTEAREPDSGAACSHERAERRAATRAGAEQGGPHPTWTRRSLTSGGAVGKVTDRSSALSCSRLCASSPCWLNQPPVQASNASDASGEFKNFSAWQLCELSSIRH